MGLLFLMCFSCQSVAHMINLKSDYRELTEINTISHYKSVFMEAVICTKALIFGIVKLSIR